LLYNYAMRIRILGIFLFSILWVSFGVSFAFAASSSSISIDVNPENPSPNQTATVTLSSYTSNLDSVTIIWSVNGKSAASGVGKKTFSVTAGNEGSTTTVEARVMLPDGEIDKRVVIAPKVMTLLWQATDSYVPPFYRGKALPVLDTEIKVVAIPEAKNSNGTNNSKNMVYDWKKNYESMPEISGYGKNYMTYVTDYLDNSSVVSVTASTVEQDYSSEAEVALNTYDPKIIFYKKDDMLGTLWRSSIEDGHQIAGDETLVAAPYFISPKNLYIPTLNWKWLINGSVVGSGGSLFNMLPVKVQPGVTGTSSIQINVSSSDKIFQNLSKKINVQF
jgi:hypothetical protein